jgi:hypothetical protein
MTVRAQGDNWMMDVMVRGIRLRRPCESKLQAELLEILVKHYGSQGGNINLVRYPPIYN